jgi:hypothetical protein
MFRKMNLVGVLAASLFLSHFAIAQTTVPLNTGYNHSVYGPYPTVNSDPVPAGNRDNFWINIASYPITGAPMGPAWILKKAPPWAAAFGGTNWIGARTTFLSPAGTAASNPAYTIFRKCFCLQPGYKEAKLRISSVRADDTIQVWLNTQTNQVIAPAWGNWNSTPLSGSTGNGFRVGKNCIYVLVEDFGGHMGFDLLGDITAYGLLPMPAAGTDQSFEPCACSQGPVGLQTSGSTMKSAMSVDVDDQNVIQAIVEMAEARRTAKQRIQYRGQPPPSP